MGCDAFANEDGVFEIEIRCYDNSYPGCTRTIRIENLDPRHKLTIEILEGEER